MFSVYTSNAQRALEKVNMYLKRNKIKLENEQNKQKTENKNKSKKSIKKTHKKVSNLSKTDSTNQFTKTAR